MALIQAFERCLTKAEVDVAYARLMLLGAAGVGKTSFKRSLMMLPWEPNTNSTMISDVESVRPFEHEWQASSFDGNKKWMKVTRDDEINELAQLLAAVHGNASSFNLLPSTKRAVALFSAPELASSIPQLEDETGDVEQITVNEVLTEAIQRANSFSEDVIMSFKPQPFVHIWDCGGQPVFLEILPAFLTSRTMFLLLFDASKDFQERWHSIHQFGGRRVPGEQSSISTLNLMLNWMANIHAHVAKDEDTGTISDYPRMFCLGTHGDRIQPDEKKTEVREKLIKEYKKKAFGELIIDTFIVDNTTSGKGDNEDPSFKLIRKAIHDFTFEKLIAKTPVSWVLFRKIIQVHKANVLTLEEVQAIGVRCKIPLEDVSKALLFYHELGVLLFYPDIKGLHLKVIISPKWFVETMSKVFTLDRCDENETSLKRSLVYEKGVIVEHHYKAAWKNNGDLEPDAIMELLLHFCLAAEVSTNLYHYADVKQFFIPAMLPSCSEEKLQAEPGYYERATYLHITFSTKFVPPGFFTRFITTIAKSQHCTLSFEGGIYRNRVSFQFGDPAIDCVIFTDHNYAIQVEILRYIPNTSSSITPFNTACQNLLQIIEEAGSTVDNVLYARTYLIKSLTSLKISRCFQYVCLSDDCQGQQLHYLNVLKNQTSDLQLCCTNNKAFRRPTPEEGHWFKDNKKPEMLFKRISQDEMYDISQAVGEKADDLAAKLGILHKLLTYRQDPSRSNNPVLHLLFDWDRRCGERKDLVKALSEIGLGQLAERISGVTAPLKETGTLQIHNRSKTFSYIKEQREEEVCEKRRVTSPEGMSRKRLTKQTRPSSAYYPVPQEDPTDTQSLLTDNVLLRCSCYINRNLADLCGGLEVPNDDLRDIKKQYTGIKSHAYLVLKKWHAKNPEATNDTLKEKLQILGFKRAAKSLEDNDDPGQTKRSCKSM